MKNRLLILLLVLLFSHQSYSALASELTDDYFDIASNYYTSNNMAKSLEYVDTILKIEPENQKALSLKNKILPPQAETVKITEEVAKPTEENFKSYSTEPRAEKIVVVDAPQQIIEKVSYDSDYYNTKGQEYYNKKELDTAIEYFYKAVNINPKNAQAYNNLGMCYQLKRNMPVAITYFKKANSINRGYTQPLVNLSLLYKQLGDVKNQLCYLVKAIKLNPNDYSAYYWIGDYYKNIDEYPKAITNFKEVVKINPKFSPAYIALASCFFETEDFNYAILALNQYMEIHPNSDEALSLMAKTYLALGKYAEAKVCIQKAIEIQDKDEYQFELAKIDYFLGDYQTALAIFQKLLQKNDNAEYFNYSGLCNYKLKESDLAIANFNKAIEVDGLRPIYYYNLAQCYKSMGDKKNYVKYVNTATKITPINYQDFIDLSYIYYDNNNPGYAINSLNNAISKYPNVKALYLAKLKIYEAIGDNLHYNETKDLIEMRFNRR